MNIKKIIIIVLTGIAILVTGILCKQQWFLMVPLFVSLFVMAFQSEANRIGVLIGAGNALLYTATYIYMGVYVSAASSLLFSVPIQLMTFFRWKKNAYKNTAVFKKMSTKVRILFTLGILALWAVTAFIFYRLDYEYALFDSLLFLFGFIVPILTWRAYIEYTYLWIIQAVVGLFLNAQMIMNDYSQATYFVYGIYALYCVICAFINVHKFYKEQQSAESDENAVQQEA
ncbi:MAG: nicotinamide mononucleotide transporter [Clostridia bacterium]|nr:nicotinamide mononucleotide transporter [Clostridia bacterium]